jgi:diguanylate cyclase (GGDEF)-like protein
MREQGARLTHYIKSGLDPTCAQYVTPREDEFISKPLCVLEEATVRTEVALLKNDEHIFELSHTENALAAAVGSPDDPSDWHSARIDIKHTANHDALTGLPNRHAVEELLALQTEDLTSRCGDESYVVLSLNLDAFNVVNDSLGHEAGDRLLLAISKRLQDTLGVEALVARHGGDEFIVVSAANGDLDYALTLVKRVLDAFDAPFSVNGESVFSSTSIGVVLAQADHGSPRDVLRDASIAMYRAKQLGKSTYVVFDKSMHEAAQARFTLGNDLRRAMERHEFLVHYQPMVDLTTGGVVGCEALVRWQHPERGLLLPSEFLDVAAEIGAIAKLDWWVLEEACKRLCEWRKWFGSNERFVVNVNLDERQLTAPHFVSELSAMIHMYEIEPQSLALEVTETIFRSGRGELQQILADLKRVGVKLVVDDFGTGYSSLESFAASPFDALKIDRSFVQDLESNVRHRAIVRTISGLARDLGLGLTAEGVESSEQARHLIELGCMTAQGFLYSRPLSQERMGALLESRLG